MNRATEGAYASGLGRQAGLLDLITEQNNLMLNSQVKIVGLLMVFVVAYSADRVGTTLLHRT